MAKFKSMLKNCAVEVAQRKRECKRTHAIIPKDEKCLVVYDGPRNRFCYCKDVALQMIAASNQELQNLERDLAV
jgi:hypothetical protein